jgi:hypothetical protein
MADPTAIYTDGILTALLRPVLDEPGGTLVPADVADRLADGGYWVAREVVGGGTTDDRFADAVSIQLDAFATDKRAGRALVRRMLGTLRLAQRRQTTTTDGHIARMTVTAWPVEVREPDQSVGFTRHVAACSLIVRPPTG